MGLILRGSEELKQQVLPSIASGEAMIATRCPSARPAPTPRRCGPAPARDGDSWVLNGTKAGSPTPASRPGTRSWPSPTPRRAPTASRRSSCTATTRASPSGPKERKLGIKGSPTCELYFENCRIPADRIIGEPGTGFKTALRDARPHPPDDRRAGRRHRAGRAGRRDRLHQGPQAVRQVASATSRACSSCSPTWR